MPADREIQFFGLPDYQETEVGNGDQEDGLENEEDNLEEYYYDEEGEEENEDESEGGGMSALEKALLAAELGMVGNKVRGMIKGRNDESSVGDQSTMSMKAKGAAARAKGAGKNFVHRVGDKMRGMKKTLMDRKKSVSYTHLTLPTICSV